MDQNFYRGARPKAEDLRSLAALGVHTIIDLTDNSRDKEQPAVEAAGMRYVNIPIVDKQNPSAAQISQFLRSLMIQPLASFTCIVRADGIAPE